MPLTENNHMCVCVCVGRYVYVYIYRERETGKVRRRGRVLSHVPNSLPINECWMNINLHKHNTSKKNF